MIIIALSGGLGNQLFQYALGQHLIQQGLDVKYDISASNNFRKFKLDCFEVPEQLISLKEVSLIERFYLKYRRTTGLCKILRFVYSKVFHYIVLENKFTDYDQQLNCLKKNCYLEGHWGKLAYFNDIKDQLLSQIVLKKELCSNSFKQFLSQITEAEYSSVSVHVRRTDYLKANESCVFKNISETDYYSKAISYINNKVKNPSFFIFSDDIDWCKNHLQLTDATYITHENDMMDYHDFELIKNCQHHINANSTFSWWAAYLDTKENKTVIVPKNWFNERKRQAAYKRGDMTPADWIKL